MQLTLIFYEKILENLFNLFNIPNDLVILPMQLIIEAAKRILLQLSYFRNLDASLLYVNIKTKPVKQTQLSIIFQQKKFTIKKTLPWFAIL